MIKAAFIKKQIEKTRAEASTSPFLRRFVLFIADKVLKEQYGAEYPLKALQSSVAVKALLLSFGIKSRIFAGAVCYPELYRDDASMFKWSGFWGEDRHVWTITEFGEFVDLAVTTLNAHPSVIRKDVIPVPAVWWGAGEGWPPFLRYLPEAPVRIQLAAAEMADIDKLHERVMAAKERLIKEGEVDAVRFYPILTGMDSIREMAEKEEPWLLRSARIGEFDKKLPEWIVNREEEIKEKEDKGSTR